MRGVERCVLGAEGTDCPEKEECVQAGGRRERRHLRGGRHGGRDGRSGGRHDRRRRDERRARAELSDKPPARPEARFSNFAKELPWVAPIAFLVAGVVEAAANVHALKRDAQIFAANVQSVENVMVDAARKGHLSKVEETCMALQFEMEEGLAFCHKLKTQYFVTQMLMSGRDCQKFKDISDSMHRQVTIIAAAASIAVHDIVMEEYEQGAQLADKIAELGGPAAVAADPEKKAACQEFMTASDALLHGAVDEVQRAVRAEAAKSQKKMDMLMEQSRAQTKVLEDQVANLTKMMEVLLATRVGMSEGARGWTFRDRTGAKQASRARKLLLPRTTPPWTARWRRASPGTRSETSCAACPWRTPRRSASRWWTSTA